MVGRVVTRSSSMIRGLVSRNSERAMTAAWRRVGAAAGHGDAASGTPALGPPVTRVNASPPPSAELPRRVRATASADTLAGDAALLESARLAGSLGLRLA